MASVKMTVKHATALGKKNTEIFNCNPAVIDADISSDTAVAIRNWAVGFVNLTTDTYDDVDITTVQSVNEIISE